VTAPLSATIEQPGGGAPVLLHITNVSDATVEVLNPDLGVPTPAEEWSYSIEAYCASLLVSFGYLSLAVTDEAGEQLARRPPQTLATPILNTPLVLAPGESFDVPVPVGLFFTLAAGHTYRLAIEYGDELKARAEGTLSPG
jgi:hypothetical protein